MEKYIWEIPVNRQMLPIELVHLSLEQQYNMLAAKPGGSINRFLHILDFAVIPPYSGFCCHNCATFLLVDERVSSVLL